LASLLTNVRQIKRKFEIIGSTKDSIRLKICAPAVHFEQGYSVISGYAPNPLDAQGNLWAQQYSVTYGAGVTDPNAIYGALPIEPIFNTWQNCYPLGQQAARLADLFKEFTINSIEFTFVPELSTQYVGRILMAYNPNGNGFDPSLTTYAQKAASIEGYPTVEETNLYTQRTISVSSGDLDAKDKKINKSSNTASQDTQSEMILFQGGQLIFLLSKDAGSPNNIQYQPMGSIYVDVDITLKKLSSPVTVLVSTPSPKKEETKEKPQEQRSTSITNSTSAMSDKYVIIDQSDTRSDLVPEKMTPLKRQETTGLPTGFQKRF
jgi:hypothetical protein